jgi:sugar phosphate isomerase/epimerase
MSKFILSAFADEIDKSLETQMDVLHEFGITHIEMRGVNGKNLVNCSIEEAKAIKLKLDERGFKLSSIGSPIGKIGIHEDFTPHLELFKHTLKIAELMEVDYIRMFSFFIPEDQDPAIYRDEVVSRWKQFVKAAEGTGITLLHENEKGIYGDTPERCLDLIEVLNCEYVKLVFDPANFVQCNVKTYPEAYELLKDHIVYMHIKDALYHDHSVVPAGQGDGNVKNILAALYRKGYEGFLSLEPHLAGFAGFAELELNSKAASKPTGGQREFALAWQALNKILIELKKEDINE